MVYNNNNYYYYFKSDNVSLFLNNKIFELRSSLVYYNNGPKYNTPLN